MSTEAIIALVASIIAIVGPVITWYVAIRRIKPDEEKSEADTADIQGKSWKALNDSTTALLVESRAETARLRADLAFERKDNERLDDVILALRAEMAALKCDVVRIPDLEYQVARIPRLEARIIKLLETNTALTNGEAAKGKPQV